MRNFGLKRFEIANSDNFTSKIGLKLRRGISKPVRKVLGLSTKRKIVIEQYPKLDNKKPYIFASNHSFYEDAQTDLSVIDRNAYILIGTTDQLEHNPKMYIAWLNGMIYVNRLDSASRKDAPNKMERILNEGTSVILYPEGGYNNSENLLCGTLFSGPYILSQRTGCQVVPIAKFIGDKEVFVKVGEPLDLSCMEKKEANELLRDSIATLYFELMEKHAPHIKRSELTGDIHMQHMEDRRREYLNVKWTRDVWDEELTTYKEYDKPQDVRQYLDDINITKENAGIVAKELVKRQEDKKYNLKTYMKKNWNK